MEKIKIGISRCLLGEKVRYDSGHKHDRFITNTLGRHLEWVPVCPEVECGLPVPREAMRLNGDPSSVRLITIMTGIDHTERMKVWSSNRLKELEREDLCGFIFKSRSPACGIRSLKIYNENSISSRKGVGIFARAFMDCLPILPVEDNERLSNRELMENFIGRVFVFRRWRRFIEEGDHPAGLADFHESHRLLMLAHSPKHASILKRYIIDLQGSVEKNNGRYIETMMKGLRLIATRKKNVKVLNHAMGFFKKSITEDDKKYLLHAIERYGDGVVSLRAPVTLLNHYAGKYSIEYLKLQHYLGLPHLLEQMLRDHIRE